MKKLALLLLLVSVFPALAAAAEVKNLKVGQEGDSAVATYDLVATAGEREAEVSVAIIIDGQRRTADRLRLSGDFGKNVKVGTGKRIVWEATADLPSNFDGELNWDVAAEVIARVNGTPITRAEADRATKVLIAQNRIPQNMDTEARKQAEDAALEQLINAEVAYQAGLKLEIQDLDKQVADKAAQGKARFPTAAEYETALKTNNITEDEVRKLIRKDIVIGRLLEQEVTGRITVTEAEIRTFYDENQDKFKQPMKYHARHILIGVNPDAPADDKRTARARAEAIRGKILAGEDFAALAKAESSCPSSSQGGDLGFFGKGEMVPPFEKAAEGLNPGEVSGVVETQFGYHIIKLVEKQEGGAMKLDTARENIRNYLKQQKTQKAATDYVSTLRSKAAVEKSAR
jgi:peptidyl-prolyl cis-trans isomerase C